MDAMGYVFTNHRTEFVARFWCDVFSCFEDQILMNMLLIQLASGTLTVDVPFRAFLEHILMHRNTNNHGNLRVPP